MNKPASKQAGCRRRRGAAAAPAHSNFRANFVAISNGGDNNSQQFHFLKDGSTLGTSRNAYASRCRCKQLDQISIVQIEPRHYTGGRKVQ